MMKSVPRWPVLAVALLALYLSMWPSKDEPQFPLDHTANMTTEENIRFYGYPYEKHLVQTEDGYILSLIRFPRRTSDKLPVLIVHGFMACSTSWVAMGPEGSLGYQLYDAGYDVWLADLRGNQYSVHHAYLERNDTRFWDFTFDEMGRFDQPAFIDYILAATGHQTLVHAGYSMGSASFFIMTSMRPEYNSKVEAHIALAPAVFMKHSETAFWKLHDSFVFLNKYLNDIQGSFVHGMMPHFFFSFCNFNFLTRRFCKHLTNNILGHSYSNKNESVYEVILHNGLTGSSLKTARHYLQLHESGGQFQRFDYGNEQLNLEHYGQPRPPHYDVSKTSTPVHIFYGATDIVCPEQDIMLLKEAITGPTDLTLVEEPNFNHGDFFMSNEARTALNPKVLEKVRLINELHSKSKVSVPPVEITNNAGPREPDQKEKV